jgi:hypothetical protein
MTISDHGSGVYTDHQFEFDRQIEQGDFALAHAIWRTRPAAKTSRSHNREEDPFKITIRDFERLPFLIQSRRLNEIMETMEQIRRRLPGFMQDRLDAHQREISEPYRLTNEAKKAYEGMKLDECQRILERLRAIDWFTPEVAALAQNVRVSSAIQAVKQVLIQKDSASLSVSDHGLHAIALDLVAAKSEVKGSAVSAATIDELQEHFAVFLEHRVQEALERGRIESAIAAAGSLTIFEDRELKLFKSTANTPMIAAALLAELHIYRGQINEAQNYAAKREYANAVEALATLSFSTSIRPYAEQQQFYRSKDVLRLKELNVLKSEIGQGQSSNRPFHTDRARKIGELVAARIPALFNQGLLTDEEQAIFMAESKILSESSTWNWFKRQFTE